MGRINFLAFILLICTLFSTYTSWRLITPAKMRFPLNLLAWTAVVSLWISFPLPILLRRVGFDHPVVDALSLVIYAGIGFMSLVLALLLLRDTAWIIGTLIRKLIFYVGFLFRSDNRTSETFDAGRREFVVNSLNGCILAASGVLTAYGAFEAFRTPRVKEVLVPVKGLLKDFEGFRIVQLTDLHINSPGKGKWVKAVVERVNRLSPDIVALTGDLADRSVASLRNDVAPLSGLSAKYGSFFVTGNHEYYSGVEEWISETKRLGFTALINEHEIVRQGKARLLLGGVTDFSAGRRFSKHVSSPKAAVAGAQETDFKILLAHQPKNIFEAAEAGFDLQLSGHTHGGQFLPWQYAISLNQPFLSGLHKFKETQIYVSRGTGYWGPPLRLGAPSEISLIKLAAA